MEFNQPKGIYLQIADQIRDRILQNEWAEGERIPSIRELAVTLGVNPNTVTKSYQALTDRGIIENQRGLGYFVANGATQAILKDIKNEFVREELPRVFRTMRLLDMDIDELAAHFGNSKE
jgi:DNA-binding transcriptional regulator YhcF (GntR family)